MFLSGILPIAWCHCAPTLPKLRTYPVIQVTVFIPSTSKDVIANIVSSLRALYLQSKRSLKTMDVSNMKMSKIMEACDDANDGSINFSQAAGLLAACHAIIMLVQSGAANRKTLRIFSRGIQQNLGDERSLEEAGVSG